jgi:hypothetical protein
MKTTEQIEDLKRQWKADPCWDIEQTRGFEAHYDQLKHWREGYERKNEESYNEQLKEFALKNGIEESNLKLAEYIRSLENRIDDLQVQIDMLQESKLH